MGIATNAVEDGNREEAIMRQRTISDYFWRDPDMCDLTQEDKATLLYLLTSPSSNIVGVYQIVWRIAAAEMGWTSEQLMDVVDRLHLRGLVSYTKSGWIWVKIWWKHNSAAGAFSPKLRQNAKNQIMAMPQEWHTDYGKSLEIAGIGRQAIPYLYPSDTMPPKSSCSSNGISNATEAFAAFKKLQAPRV